MATTIKQSRTDWEAACEGGSFDAEHDAAADHIAILEGALTATVASLDGTPDAADWLTPGHTLDHDEVQYLRSLIVPPK